MALVLLLGFSTTVSAQTNGQVKNYTATNFSGNFSSIAGLGTTIPVSSSDDGANTIALTMPFDFTYDGTLYATGTAWGVSTNGFMKLGATPPTGCCSDWVGSSSYPNTILPMSYDGYVWNGMEYQVTGSSPNRVLTVEWKRFSVCCSSTNTNTLQVKLYETTNVIEFLYGTNGGYLGGSFGTGLNGNSPASDFLRVGQSQTSTPSSNWRFTPPAPPATPQLTTTPKSVDFGQLVYGQSSTQCITVKNVGSANSKLSIASASTGSPDFTVVSVPSGLLAANQSDQVCVRYSPVTPGAKTATLTIQSNGTDSATQTISLKGFGLVPSILMDNSDLFRKTRTRFGSSITACIPIQSNGVGPLTINSVSIQGSFSDQYAITRRPATTIQSGSYDTLCVTYTPTSEGLRVAQLVINSNAANNPTITINMYGTGTLPRLVVSPFPVNFDSVAIGDTACKTITLYNPGTDTIAIKQNLLTTADADFSYTPLTPGDTLIAPEKSKQVNLCFHPIKQGTRVARIRYTTNIPLTFETPRRDTSAFDQNIVGYGIPYGVLAVRTTTGIDSVIINTQVCRVDTFTNTGAVAITVTGGTITGNDAADFKINGVNYPVVVQPGAKLTFSVCGTPSARGIRSAQASFTATSNDRTTTVAVPIGVYGLAVCSSADPMTAFSTTTGLGMSDTATICISNCGDVAETFTVAAGTTTYKVVDAPSTPVAPGASACFKVAFTPTTCGAATDSIMITGTNGVMPIGVALNGNAAGATYTAAPASSISGEIGTTSDVTVNITNTSTMPWTPGTPTITGSPAFTIKTANLGTIAAGASAPITLTFAPTAVGTQNATINFPASMPKECTVIGAPVTGQALAAGVRTVAEKNGFRLEQNYPNPFNPSTEIRFTVPRDGQVRLIVTDVTGRTVKTLIDERMTAGQHSAVFDGANLASGTYYYKLISGKTELTRSMVLNK